MAAATAAEKAHRASTSERSPVASTSYGISETDLFRFKESKTDEVLSAFVEEWHALPEREADELRAKLTMEDFYTLLTFARRSALLTLRSRSPHFAIDGLKAIAMIDSDRIDWRDASWAAALNSFATGAVDKDAMRPLEAIAERADATISDILARFRREPVSSLSEWGFRVVDADTGPVLVQDDGRPYEPSHDLLALACDVTQVLEGDVWRVRGFTTGSGLPEVWVAEGDAERVAAATRRLRGCVSLNAELETAYFERPETQHLLGFIAQAASAEDAKAIGQAAGPGTKKWFVALGLSTGDLCGVLVSRSVYEGVDTFEGSLDRFRDGVQEALSRYRE